LNEPLWLNRNVQFKQPRSIQVVIFAETPVGRRYLLLKRIDSQGGFWQSVTGSLEAGETHPSAAVREVFEETGISCVEQELIDLGVLNNFEIATQWRHKYAPGTTHNEEVCFGLRVEECEVKLDLFEHQAYAWESYERAIALLFWESSKRAFAAAQLFADYHVREVKNR
jgi:dihydroneopterin triphosphate diphosphatase